MKDRYNKGEQTLLFLNRRGYYSFLFCSNCSHVLKCPHCDVTLTYHKNQNILLCHSCYYKTPPNVKCPCCSSDTMQYKGYGTEHVERSIKALMPEVRTLRVDKDTTSSKHSHDTIFKQFRSGKADVLIGTQMIVKGLHFPSVTLVGVLNSDSALNYPDFRCSETTFQLLTQVAGRSGRSSIPGEVVIQTFLPDNRVIHLASNQHYEEFYNEDIASRQLFSYPPFSHIVKFLFSGHDNTKTIDTAKLFRSNIIKHLTKDTQIHPLIPTARAKIKDKYRHFFLIRGSDIISLTKTIGNVKKNTYIPSSVSLFIDVDPINTSL